MADCFDESYDENKTKEEIFKHYEYSKNKVCCDDYTCKKLVIDLEKLDNNCETIFKPYQKKLDPNGRTIGTICEETRNKINRIKNSECFTKKKSNGGKNNKSNGRKNNKRKKRRTLRKKKF